ncbi:M24 family metallopeptidase, partial [Bacillus cereus]|nr:M24 family metallopeptidase [Bacillus cereus]
FRSDTVLEPGMSVTVEPGIYIPGIGGVRIEDDIIVTSEGNEVITKSPKELIIL